ncbi:YolD-like family protein [Sporolactobacillus kofuensis]|uniref:YolD-like family protein n=1 Tax=Sporolactobacillus kofuensis TaxID=269672 RepID=A0ABW1WDI5_9BACL|nr:YolD-like family protein [Sporolactobacillus kofuensis]MCO7175510.1 YolD-like family protein [Sporolactobacillus kofuensis]
MKTNKLTNGSNMRWESSRMMLPEHVQALRALANEETKISKPQLDEQKWEEIERIVHDAIYHRKRLNVSYYKDGAIKDLSNSEVNLNQNGQSLQITDSFGIRWTIAAHDLIDVAYSAPINGDSQHQTL